MALTLENFKSVYGNALSRSNPSDNASYVNNIIQNRTDVILSKLYNSYNNSNQTIINNTNMASYSTVDDVFVLKFNGTPAEDFFSINNITSFSLDNSVYYNGNVIDFIMHINSYINQENEPYKLEENFLNNLFFTVDRDAPFDLYYGTDTQRVKDVQRNRNIYVKATGPEPYTEMYIPIVTTGWSGAAAADQRAIPFMYQNYGWPDLPLSSQNFNWTKNHYNVYVNVGGQELSKPIASLTPSVSSSAILKAADNTTYTVYIWRQEDVEEQLRWLGISRVAYTEQQATFVPYEELPDTGTDEGPYDPGTREPGTPTKTEKGQVQNDFDNDGGTGDRSSDSISDLIPSGVITSTGMGTGMYALNYKQLLTVLGEVWKPGFLQTLTSLTNSPASTIISCQLWPLDLSNFSGALPKSENTILLGTYKIDIDDIAQQIQETLGDVYIFSNITNAKVKIVENYKLDNISGSFLDYEPYTKIKIYIPYVGIQEISAQHVFNKTLNVYYNIDITTGMAKAIIEVDGTPLYSWKIDLGVDIPITSTNFADIKQKAVLGGIGAAINAGTGMITGGASMISQGMSQAVSTVGSTLGAMSYATAGSTGSSLERMDPQGCYLIIEYVNSFVPDGFNHTKGRPSLITTKLSNLKGFTTIEESHFEIANATESEKNEIESIFKEGVIIK